jgi:hypothetical protein
MLHTLIILRVKQIKRSTGTTVVVIINFVAMVQNYYFVLYVVF